MDPQGVPWEPLRSFGAPPGYFLGSLAVLLAAVGCLRSRLGVRGGSWDVLGRLRSDFRDFTGNFGRPFGSLLG